MSEQSSNSNVSVPSKYTPTTTAIAPFQTSFTIAPMPTMSSELEPFVKSSNSLDKSKLKSHALTILQSKEVEEARKATAILPSSVANLDMQIDILSQIDVSDPNSYEIITPTPLINYYEHFYGDVDMDLIEPAELTSLQSSIIDISALPISISRNASLDFIYLDPSMAFLVSNGTSPENIVIADNMQTERTGNAVLLSLNNNSEQNKAVIYSSELKPISVSLPIPLGLDPIQVNDIIIDISNKTETLQLYSPDFVNEPLPEESEQLYRLGFLSGVASLGKSLVTGVQLKFQNIKSYIPEFFGDSDLSQIRRMLENPKKSDNKQFNEDKKDKTKGIRSGTFLIVLHGAIASQGLVSYDCNGFDRLSFISRYGLILESSIFMVPDHLANHPDAQLSFKASSHNAVENICRMPNVRFSVDKDTSSIHNGIKHIDKDGNIRTILTTSDLLQIFGSREINMTTLLNLMRYISKSDNIKLDIATCLSSASNKLHLSSLRLGSNHFDIPTEFVYRPQKYIPKPVDRIKGKAEDSVCRLGNQDGDVLNCRDHVDKMSIIDPNLGEQHDKGIVGMGIQAALDDDIIRPDVYAVFKNKKNEVYQISANHFVYLHKWNKEGSLLKFFKSERFKQLGLNSKISVTHILDEMNTVLQRIKDNGEDITFSKFSSELIEHLRPFVSFINEHRF